MTARSVSDNKCLATVRSPFIIHCCLRGRGGFTGRLVYSTSIIVFNTYPGRLVTLHVGRGGLSFIFSRQFFGGKH